MNSQAKIPHYVARHHIHRRLVKKGVREGPTRLKKKVLFKCDICGTKPIDVKSLRSHMIGAKHVEICARLKLNPYTIQRPTRANSNYLKKMEEHVGEVTFKCKECGYENNSGDSFLEHIVRENHVPKVREKDPLLSREDIQSGNRQAPRREFGDIKKIVSFPGPSASQSMRQDPVDFVPMDIRFSKVENNYLRDLEPRRMNLFSVLDDRSKMEPVGHYDAGLDIGESFGSVDSRTVRLKNSGPHTRHERLESFGSPDIKPNRMEHIHPDDLRIVRMNDKYLEKVRLDRMNFGHSGIGRMKHEHFDDVRMKRVDHDRHDDIGREGVHLDVRMRREVGHISDLGIGYRHQDDMRIGRMGHLNELQIDRMEHTDDVRMSRMEHTDDVRMSRMEQTDDVRMSRMEHTDDIRMSRMEHTDDIRMSRMEHADDIRMSRMEVRHPDDMRNSRIDHMHPDNLRLIRIEHGHTDTSMGRAGPFEPDDMRHRKMVGYYSGSNRDQGMLFDHERVNRLKERVHPNGKRSDGMGRFPGPERNYLEDPRFERIPNHQDDVIPERHIEEQIRMLRKESGPHDRSGLNYRDRRREEAELIDEERERLLEHLHRLDERRSALERKVVMNRPF